MESQKLLESQKPFRRILRSLLGGALMGLANLVPGISGGTMLPAAGVYPQFIESVAEISTLRFNLRNLITLGAIGGAALTAIVALAGPMKYLVVHHRWAMYSLFIGLTLGGVPVIWRLLKRMTRSAAAGCAAGIAVMTLMALVEPGGTSLGASPYWLLFLAGLGGASAMVLPGISGGYVLLILGQYVTVLGAVDQLKTGLLGGGAARPDGELVTEALRVIVPVGLGVAAGIVGFSNLIKALLARFEKATLSLLLGLLLGAVIGLWPFQRSVEPQPGDRVWGRVMTADAIRELQQEDYPLERFSPTGAQIGGALGLLLTGFLVTQGIALAGGGRGRALPQEEQREGKPSS